MDSIDQVGWWCRTGRSAARTSKADWVAASGLAASGEVAARDTACGPAAAVDTAAGVAAGGPAAGGASAGGPAAGGVAAGGHTTAGVTGGLAADRQQLDTLQLGHNRWLWSRWSGSSCGGQQVSWQRPWPQLWSEQMEPQQKLTMVSEGRGSGTIFRRAYFLNLNAFLLQVLFYTLLKELFFLLLFILISEELLNQAIIFSKLDGKQFPIFMD